MGSAWAIVVAAGRGERMGGGPKKQFRLLQGRPVLHWSLEALFEAPSVDGIVVVAPAEDVDRLRQELTESFPGGRVASVVEGGSSRAESVRKGLSRVPETCAWVIVHDAARPLLTPELVGRVLDGARQSGAATAAIPMADTVKEADERGFALRTLDRSRLWRIQTPQAFRRELLWEAHQRAGSGEATDDCQLVEALGAQVRLVEGDPRNLKITTEGDWAVVQALAETPARSRRRRIATGFGFDLHRLVEGRRLVLGGVEIPYPLGLLGHSDADALAHAVIDALLGAASLGDIGTHFPDTDPRYSGADSLHLLEEAAALARRRGVRVLHVDAFVSAEAPRLRPHIEAMRRNLASAIGVDAAQVNVKAGTGEGAGPVGRGEVIEARAVVTVERED